jgi:hypothetical protein
LWARTCRLLTSGGGAIVSPLQDIELVGISQGTSEPFHNPQPAEQRRQSPLALNIPSMAEDFSGPEVKHRRHLVEMVHICSSGWTASSPPIQIARTN